MFGSSCLLDSSGFWRGSILTKSLCVLYAFLMIKRLVLFRSPLLCCDAAGNGEGARMLAVVFIVSCLAVFSFYGYVLVHLRREKSARMLRKTACLNIYTK